MSGQLNMFSTQPSGQELRDLGIQKAEDSANSIQHTWSEQAYNQLLRFIKKQSQFMTEQFRSYAEKEGLQRPPSNRAYGSVIVRAVKSGIIKRIDYKPVQNPKAHCTPASVWAVVN